MVFVQEKCKINNYDIRNGDYYYCIQLKNKIYLSEFSSFSFVYTVRSFLRTSKHLSGLRVIFVHQPRSPRGTTPIMAPSYRELMGKYIPFFKPALHSKESL